VSKLWLLTQNVNTGYDTYDSAIVCADDEESAKQITPDHKWYGDKEGGYRYTAWAYKPEEVKAQYIGEADPAVEVGEVVLSSFNAG
jgi:hypothetical protein